MNTATTTYLLGNIATERGLTVHRDACGEQEYGRLRTDDFALTHPRTVPLCMRHDEDWQLGDVHYLEKVRGQLFVLAELNANGVDIVKSSDVPLYLSAASTAASYDEYGTRIRVGARLREISITPSPAHRGLAPVVWGEGFPHRRASLFWEDTWNRGVTSATTVRRRDRTELEVYDVEHEEQKQRAAAKPKPSPTLAPVATRADVLASRTEVLPPGVHRRVSGHIISYEGKPLG